MAGSNFVQIIEVASAAQRLRRSSIQLVTSRGHLVQEATRFPGPSLGLGNASHSRGNRSRQRPSTATPCCRDARDAHEAATALGLTEAERAELVPSGVQTVYKNRAGWAHDRLKRAGLSTSLRRGYWQLTPQGIAFAAAHPAPLAPAVVEDLATEHNDVRLRPATEAEEQPSVPTGPVSASATASPDDRLEQALGELRQSVAGELVEMLTQVSPPFFEKLVLDLLHRMGYGTSRSDLKQVGGVGDGGIDGVISLDRLGLEKVYVQAKRWQNSVGRPEIQAFYGALAGQRATKGVFITTSTFTQQALEFARSVERVVLVDGTRLANLMIEHEVGVSLRSLKVPKLDTDYFEE